MNENANNAVKSENVLKNENVMKTIIRFTNELDTKI